MKKYFFVLCIAFFVSQSAQANPGDTTWVQANIAQMTYTGNYDSAVVFPNTGATYRKILMIFTLGKYVCPGSPQYCGSWDYIVNNYIMTPGGDTMEISRLITPYATTSSYFPNSWSYNYVFDVSDYASLLKSNGTVRVAFGGYSYGFTVNVRFAFIEGTPDRNVLGIQRLWHGQFSYGVTTDPITNHVYPLTATVPAGTVTTDMKMRITGHGEDGNNCNEFCPNTYSVLLNNGLVTTQNFFRNTCGLNPIYPQTGTWPYDRSGWCPGSLVYDIYNPLAAAGTYSVNVTFPAYTTVASSSGNSNPSYDIEAAIVSYGNVNKNLDASLDEILAPNNDPNYSRSNSVCGEPVVHVHNSGSTTITSLSINYGVVGTSTNNYVWNGSLSSLRDTDITLPSISPLRTDAGTSTVQHFTASIAQVNGTVDDDTTNNNLISNFTPAVYWQDSMFIIKMKTSGVASYPETWQIQDMSGNVLASRTGTTQKTLYVDTAILGSGCYKLIVSTPDGYGFVFGTYYTGNTADNGYMLLYKYGFGGPTTIPNYRGGDFGTGFTQYFSTNVVVPSGVTTEVVGNETIEVYPNPAQNYVNIDISGVQQVDGTIEVIDALGRLMTKTICTASQKQINVAGFANGVYTIVFTDNKHPENRLTTRLLIAK